MPSYSADEPISRVPITVEDINKRETIKEEAQRKKEEERLKREAEKYAKPPIGAYFICYYDNTDELRGGPFDTEADALAAAKEAVLEDNNDNDEEVLLILRIAKKVKLFREFKEENLE